MGFPLVMIERCATGSGEFVWRTWPLLLSSYFNFPEDQTKIMFLNSHIHQSNYSMPFMTVKIMMYKKAMNELAICEGCPNVVLLMVGLSTPWFHALMPIMGLDEDDSLIIYIVTERTMVSQSYCLDMPYMFCIFVRRGAWQIQDNLWQWLLLGFDVPISLPKPICD